MRKRRAPWTAALLALSVLGVARTTMAADPPRGVAVGPQYGSTHVYLAPDDLDRFVTSLIATFGGHAGPTVHATVTPTPSTTILRIVPTPVGPFSVFGYTTPIPYPFGAERTGYLVTDIDDAVAAARRAGAEIVVAPFSDAIGRDAIIRWPGGVMMQLYWHTTSPSAPPLAAVPENRIYLSADAVQPFLNAFTAFSGAGVTQDDPAAPGAEIGRPGATYRRIRLTSPFGDMTLFVTDGHLPWPYGCEIMGYAVPDLAATLDRARAAGVAVLAGPFRAVDRDAAMLQFPGGFVAEIHAMRTP